MTREESIKILQGAIKKPNTKDGYLGQAIDMAIKALEQQTCEDTVSRQAVLDLISKFILEIHTEGGRDLNAHTNDVLRQILRNVGSDRVLPSVNPQPKTGHWKEVYAETDYRNGWIEFSCENCEYQHGLESGEYGWSYGDPIPWKYCPICGAKMVEPQERSDEE